MGIYRALANTGRVVFDNRMDQRSPYGVTTGTNEGNELDGSLTRQDLEVMILHFHIMYAHSADEVLLLVLPEGCPFQTPNPKISIAQDRNLINYDGHGDVLLFDANRLEVGGVVAYDVRWAPRALVVQP